MILLLLTCSTSWCQSELDDPDYNYTFPTGEVESIDSVLVPISAIRIATAKMVELNYEKEINATLRECVQNDSLLINALSTNLAACEVNTNVKVAEIKKQRNIAIITGGGTSLLFLVLFIIAL